MHKKTRKAHYTSTPEQKKELGKRVRIRMTELEISVLELSEIVGLSPHYISRVRSGRLFPAQTQTAIRLAAALNVTLDKLIFG